MRQTLISFTLLTLAVYGNSTSAAHPQEEGKPQAEAKLPDLIGTWSYTGGERDGAELKEDHFGSQRVVITEKQISLTGDQEFEFDYQLTAGDSTKIDLTMTKSPFGAGAKAVGIIELKDGVLSLCYDSTGQNRPAAFEAPAGSSLLSFKLKRQPVQAEKLVGAWKLVRGIKNGEPLAKDRLSASTLEISPDAFTLSSSDQKFVMSYKLDAKANPTTIDFTMTESPFGPGATAPGIIQKLGDKQFILCYAPTGGDRPTRFASEKASDVFLFVWEKND